MDGIGIAPHREGNAVKLARTPTLDRLMRGSARLLKAHGTAVGLPTDDDMGNSEVGHNALGAGRVFAQGQRLVNDSIRTGALFEGPTWQRIVQHGQTGTVHFIGLLSDGGVHSHMDHLFAMLRAAAKAGCQRLRVHALLDGRDVAPTSALIYADALEAVLSDLTAAGIDAAVASGGGRMVITMDRYEADWPMVARGWAHHVHSEGRRFASLHQAIATLREETPGLTDQQLPGFVVGAPAPMRDGDAVVLFNFRGDRALELTRAFETAHFTAFDRGRVPRVLFAGMMQYDGDLQLPTHTLVAPPAIDHTMSQWLAQSGVHQLAISETQKYGHVTYFWNGNRSGAFDPTTETYIEVPSDVAPFEERPWMKAAEITDRLIAEINTRHHAFLRVNYPNGDMVGHTGSFAAAQQAVEAVDLQLARLLRATEAAGGVLLVTADHGNADEMFQLDKRGTALRTADGTPLVKTSHTLAPVPLALWDPSRQRRLATPDDVARPELGHVAATCLELLGFLPPAEYMPSLLR